MFKPSFDGRFAAILIVLLCGAVGVAGAGEKTVTLRVDPATFTWAPSPEGTRIQVEGAVTARVAGSLELPLLPVTVLPPDGQRLLEVVVLAAGTEPVFFPGPPAVYRPEGWTGDAVGTLPQSDLVRRGPGGYIRGDRVDGFVVALLQPAPEGEGWELVRELNLLLRFGPDSAEDVVRPLRGRQGLDGRLLPGRVFDLTDRPVLDAGSPAAGRELSLAAAGQAFDPRFNPSLDGSPVEYVIVTNEALAAEFDRLADWKTRSGTPTVVRTVEWIRQNYPAGADLQERVRSFIRDAVTYWGTEWVLLGGDTPILPARYGRTTYFGGERIPTDLYFQCLDGGWNRDGDENFGEGYRTANRPGDGADLMPDVWVGRLPVNTVAETRVELDKILTYEMNPPVDAGYPASNLMLAEVLFPKNWSPDDTVLFDGADLSEETLAHFPSGFPARRLYENHVPFAGAEPETVTTAIAAINQGYGIVNHIGHGYIQNMAVGLSGQNINIPDADQFTNGDRASVLYAINCTSAAIDFDCIAEHFMNNPNGGAVACVGATRYDFPGTSHFYSLEFYDLIFDDGVDRLGQTASMAKFPYLALSEDDNAHRWTQFTLIYLGDPHLRIWTGVPETLTVSHEAAVALGENDLTMQVSSEGAPVAGAEVTLYKAGETFATGLTDAAGAVTLTAKPHSEGALLVTVTGVNLLPYLGDVTVSPAVDAYPLVTAVLVDDDEGESANGHLDAGETAELVLSIANRGTVALSGIGLSAADTGPVSFVGAGAGPATLAAGEEADYRFEVVVAGDAADLTTVVAVLNLAADQGSWSPEAVLHVGAPSLDIYELNLVEEVGDGDGLPEAGETVALTPRIANRGTGTTRQLSGLITLVQANGAVILDGETDFGVLAEGGVSSVAAVEPLRVKLGRDEGLPLLRLSVSDAFGLRLAVPLDLEPPDPPAAPVAAGAEKRISLHWTPSSSADLARYVVYRSESPSGPFERITGLQESATSLLVDEPLPGLAVRYYKVASQDSSGNLSPASEVARGVTSLPLVQSFPVAADLGTQASPLSVDLDGDGRLELVTGREEIYVLRADGSEARDGDDDPSTLGPWTAERPQNGFWASPAVADLTGDGRLEMVGVGFMDGRVYVWDYRGRLLPGWPQATDGGSVIAIGTPALADLTGDGLPEIIIHAGTALYAFDRFGNEVLDGDEDPSTHGVFFYTGSVYSYGSVGAADFDGDGKAEIVMPTRGDIFLNPPHGQVYLLDDDGTPMPGWPVTFRGAVTSSPAIVDLNGDGALDIVVATGADSVEARSLDGSSLAGWPQPGLMNQDIMCSPGVADLDRDGSLDVAVISGNGTVDLWHADGTRFEGFPYRYTDALSNSISARGSPTLVNLDEDEYLELLTSNSEGGILALNHDGTLADGFPLQLNGPADGGILVADLDGDGMNEMGISCFDRSIYLFRTNGHVTTDTGWPMFRHDPRRTGYLGTPLLEATTPRMHLAVLQSGQLPGLGSVYAVATRDLDGGAAMTLDGEALTVEEVDAERRFYRAAVALEPGAHVLGVSGTAMDGVPGTGEKNFEVVSAPSARGWLLAPATGVRLWAATTEGWPARLLLARVPREEMGMATDFRPPALGGVLVQVGPEGAAVPAGTRIEFATPETWEGAAVEHWDGAAWRALARGESEAGAVTVAAERFGWFRLIPASAGEGRPPVVLAVDRPRPNPSPGATRIAFSLSGEGRVRADLFDIRGARLLRLADEVFPAGDHELVWTGRDDRDRPAPAGVYFLRVTGESGTVTRKLVRVSEGGGR